MKKIIKLINDERLNRKLNSGMACDSTSKDSCAIEDHAGCTVFSEDYCGKDFAGCTNNSFDYCGESGGRDFYACHSGENDFQ